MTGQRPWFMTDPAIPSGALHALTRTYNGIGDHHPSWTPENVFQLAYRIVRAPRRVHSIDGLLHFDAEKVFDVIDTLSDKYVYAMPTIAAALDSGIPLDDLAWLAQQDVAWLNDPLNARAIALVAETPNPAARRLALLVTVTMPSAPSQLIVACAEALDHGHEDVARYVLDGMTLRDAVRAAHAQDTLDRRNIVTRTNQDTSRSRQP